MRSKDLLRLLKTLGCEEVKTKGCHIRVRCGPCTSELTVHAREDIPTESLREVERQLEPCLGRGWLKR